MLITINPDYIDGEDYELNLKELETYSKEILIIIKPKKSIKNATITIKFINKGVISDLKKNNLSENEKTENLAGFAKVSKS